MGSFEPTAFEPTAFDMGAVVVVVPPDPTPGALPATSYARMMLALFPPGRLWRLVGSTLASTITACADELTRLHTRALDLIEESDPTTAYELLPEYERDLEIGVGVGTIAERRARVVARIVARQRYRPVDLRTALAPLLGQTPAAVTIIERSHAVAVTMGALDGREIFRFFVYRNPALPGSYYVASAQALLDAIKPSNTSGAVIESINMLCDDPYSLCDRDILGI